MTKSDALIGQELGNILIQQPLGHGGMARVYKGFDQKLRRPVAIKVIAENLRTSSTYTQRFERESQAVANLKHPNIVTIFHFGNQDGLYYLIMEYIDGIDLDAILRTYEDSGELMPHADVLRILQDIGTALDYAHTQGVIHRDVKPSNIMLERNGRPVLTDFGLALRISEGTVGDTFGSPHYVSPEQARSSSNAVSQSDIYSLGVVAYELLTGVVPFDDPSPAALAVQHMTTEVPSPRILNRNLSEGVEAVLFKVLAKEPKERYRTCKAFVAALRKALKEQTQKPVKASKADLPPLPAGVELPPPRRLSMQSARDKLDQELASAQAAGGGRVNGAPRRSRRLSCVLKALMTLVAIAVVGLFASRFLKVPLIGSPAVSNSNGQVFTMLWNNVTFYGANQSQDDLLMGNLTFERLLTDGNSGERYEGKRWTAYYPHIQAEKCVVLKTADHFSENKACANGINSTVTAQRTEIFWTPTANSVEFRVLWDHKEITRCQIALKRCEVRLPSK